MTALWLLFCLYLGLYFVSPSDLKSITYIDDEHIFRSKLNEITKDTMIAINSNEQPLLYGKDISIQILQSIHDWHSLHSMSSGITVLPAIKEAFNTQYHIDKSSVTQQTFKSLHNIRKLIFLIVKETEFTAAFLLRFLYYEPYVHLLNPNMIVDRMIAIETDFDLLLIKTAKTPHQKYALKLFKDETGHKCANEQEVLSIMYPYFILSTDAIRVPIIIPNDVINCTRSALLMQYIPGHYLTHHTFKNESEANEMVESISKIVHVLASIGFAHVNIDPWNIVIDEDGHWWLTGFENTFNFNSINSVADVQKLQFLIGNLAFFSPQLLLINELIEELKFNATHPNTMMNYPTFDEWHYLAEDADLYSLQLSALYQLHTSGIDEWGKFHNKIETFKKLRVLWKASTDRKITLEMYQIYRSLWHFSATYLQKIMENNPKCTLVKENFNLILIGEEDNETGGPISKVTFSSFRDIRYLSPRNKQNREQFIKEEPKAEPKREETQEISQQNRILTLDRNTFRTQRQSDFVAQYSPLMYSPHDYVKYTPTAKKRTSLQKSPRPPVKKDQPCCDGCVSM